LDQLLAVKRYTNVLPETGDPDESNTIKITIGIISSSCPYYSIVLALNKNAKTKE
jgi:hypothetical protein